MGSEKRRRGEVVLEEIGAGKKKIRSESTNRRTGKRAVGSGFESFQRVKWPFLFFGAFFFGI